MSITAIRGFFLGMIISTSLLVIYMKLPDGSLGKKHERENGAAQVFTGRDLNFYDCNIPKLSSFEEFFDYGKSAVMNNSCLNLVGFGGQKNNDGKKMVCLDRDYSINSGNCIVFSFGISKDWSFDDSMDKFGCKVYSFDPTIDKPDHNRSTNIRFFNLGLSDVNGYIKLGPKNCSVDRYEEILQRLGLVNHKIDYLKIDIEGSELNFFKDVFTTTPNLLKNVKQIGMEIHPSHVQKDAKLSSTSRIQSYWKYMKGLECFGFTILSYELNMVGGNPYKWNGRQESSCYEIVWGNKLWLS